MRLLLSLGATVALSVGVLACGSDEKPSTDKAPTTSTNTTTSTTSTATGGFTGQAANAYKIAKQVCGAFPPEKVAHDLGVSANVNTSEGIVSIAEAYGKQYDGPASQAAFEGCLDALPNP